IQLPEQVERAALLADNRGRRYRGARYRYRTRVHIVRRGDTLFAIARRMGTNVRTLAALNGLSPDDPLRTGQRLRVSSGGSHLARSAVRVRRRSRASHHVHHAGLVATADAASLPDAAAGNGRRMHYVVRRGDTLYRIAQLLQVTVNDLLSWNGIDNSRSLRPGQVLVAFVKSRG
ncbi:MAG: LysM peptidoglycan-binding domain-containing protein, partial [Steroidobacteraceae bacterium]